MRCDPFKAFVGPDLDRKNSRDFRYVLFVGGGGNQLLLGGRGE